jgi:hypothetical protein
MAIASRRALKGAACAALALLLAACAREGQDQMSWARAALERNGQIEIVAADPQSRTFTVRVKDSGELRMVRADQVVAGPALSTTVSTAAAAPAATPAAPQALTASTAADTDSAAPAEPAAMAAAPAEETAATRPLARTAGGAVLESGPGYSIQAASGAAAAAVTQSGPGYSIAASGAPAAAAPARARLRDAGVTSAAVERRREPIVCQGSRLLHIDNRNLEFDGNAVSAEDGCEIHITNSHISATGIGVLARGANVHIDNSLIEGDAGSIDASDGAQVYAAFSHFRGLSRRLDTAVFHDLGGNIWN